MHPQPSSIADVAPQDTRGPLAASPLPHTKTGAHALTRKTYVANQNNICPKSAQEDIADGSVSSMTEPYRAHHASRPKLHRAQTISTLSSLSQESNRMAPSNVFHAFVAFFHTSSSCEAYLPFSYLIKKFFVTLKHLPVAPSCMLSIERFNTNNHNQCQ
jgi:hypothetical protein